MTRSSALRLLHRAPLATKRALADVIAQGVGTELARIGAIRKFESRQPVVQSVDKVTFLLQVIKSIGSCPQDGNLIVIDSVGLHYAPELAIPVVGFADRDLPAVLVDIENSPRIY